MPNNHMFDHATEYNVHPAVDSLLSKAYRKDPVKFASVCISHQNAQNQKGYMESSHHALHAVAFEIAPKTTNHDGE